MFDNGKQFDNPKFRDFCAELGIKNYSSPAHPQYNGQAEVTIRTLKAILKTKLENLKKKWVEYLPEVLWAYRTMHKSATQETPFTLAFGTEAVAPVEVRLKSPRVEFASIEHNEEALRLNLDFLEEKREQVLKRAKDYHRKTARYYDRRVKPRSYKPSDLVLKKLMPARKDPIDHLNTYKNQMELHGYQDPIRCRAFAITLKGPTLAWFNRLLPSSISSITELSIAFVSHFIGVRTYRKAL